MKRLSILISIIFIFCSCNDNDNDKHKDKNIVGKWEMVYMSETGGRQLPRGISIEFFDDGTFITNDARGDEIAEGTWDLKKNDSMLLLQNEGDVQDLSEWNLNISGYTMQWTGTKDFETENLQLKFTKSGDK